jgi:eukaryotic-like serine/threonine-protein kinase
MRVVRVFVSSPGDTVNERKRVARVIARLNADLAGIVRLESVLWEDRFYSAHAGFQPQIAKSIDCEIVIAILRGRLGTPLPPEFAASLPSEERLRDDEYPSGTAYEILTAIAARKQGKELPDIFVFRYPRAPFVALDEPSKSEIEAQWEKLKLFAEQVFVSVEGHFKGAYQTFSSIDEFEIKVEGALRQWLGEHVLKGRAIVWPIPTKGSPFRGLEAFGAKHAEVFFGRNGDCVRGFDRLTAAAEAGFPCLIVIGPSGAGKSSFVRAGLLPYLVKPGAVSGVAVWRTALMRPSDHPNGAVESLAQHLFDSAADISEQEQGRPMALPELSGGERETPRALTELFLVFARGQFPHPSDAENAARAAMAPLLRALRVVGEAEQKSWNSEKVQPARLLIVVDQLDEIFAPGVTEEARLAFTRLIDALARTGVIWIVLTLRAESYDVFLKSALGRLATLQRSQPVALNESAGIASRSSELELTFNLRSPGMVEFAEIVRGPAAAAGLEWDVDPVSKERLDDRILADIDQPDLLPLVQFGLNWLYERRERRGDDVVLTFAAYRELGRLDGAIDQAAQRTLNSLAPADQMALPRLLRMLVSYPIPDGGVGKPKPMLRVAPLDKIVVDEASRRLVEALTNARILVSSHGDAGIAIVSLAHQRGIEAWATAKRIVADNEAVIRIRGDIEAAWKRWSDTGKPRDLLIPPGLPLSEAEKAVAVLNQELSDEIRDFVAASGRAARLRQRIVAAAAVVFFALATLAGFLAQSFLVERDRARQNFIAATQAVSVLDDMIWNVNQGAQNIVGVRLSTLETTLGQIRHTVDALVAKAPDDVNLMGVKAAMLNNFVDAYLQSGAFKKALAAAEEAVTISQAMASRSRTDPKALTRLAVSLYKRGDVRRAASDVAGQTTDSEAALAAARQAVDAAPGDPVARHILWAATGKLGEAQLAGSSPATALSTFSWAVTLAEAAVAQEKRNSEWRRDLAISFANRGNANAANGDINTALSDYVESLAQRRELAKDYPGNPLFSSDVVLILIRIGQAKHAIADQAGTRVALDEALNLARQIAGADPASARSHRHVAVVLAAIGDATFNVDPAAARIAYEESLTTLRNLLAIDNDNAGARLDLANVLAKVALGFSDADQYGTEALALFSELQDTGRLSPREESDVALLLQQLRPKR